MDRDEYLAGVTELYQGEVIGEGLFSCMLSTCAPEHRNAVAQLLQLESEAKIRLRPLLLRLGISIVEDESLRAAGVAFAKQLAEKPWREAMRSLGELSQPYLRRYKALEANAPAADLTDVSPDYSSGRVAALILAA